jgi:hypothetical protein
MTNTIVIAVCKTYRRINIYETESGFEIIGTDNTVYPFSSWSEATAFVDAWYAVQFVFSNQ